MGGDGGQVIDRATMIKCKGYGLTKESGGRHANSLGEMNSYIQMVSEDSGLPNTERHAWRMTTCWLSQQVLRDPVVACRLGNLYNKELLINALLNKSIPKEISHVRALKDVKLCHITWKTSEKEGKRRMVCPISREDLDAGGSRAVVIWSTGAVVSPKSLKELKLKECPVTGKPFDAEQDLIPLAPVGAELEKLQERLPAKKRKASASSAPAAAEGAEAAAASKETAAKVQKTQEAEGDKVQGTEIYQKLFTKDEPGWNGRRDGFGTPAFNRGQAVK